MNHVLEWLPHFDHIRARRAGAVQARARPAVRIERLRILCPVDFDLNSLVALELACDLVRGNDGILYVLHVWSAQDPSVAPVPIILPGTQHFARVRLNQIARESLRGIDHRLLLRHGQPASRIVEAAAQLTVHLLVLATHRRGDAPQCLLGSTAEQVVREAPCPVLTIRGTVARDSSTLHDDWPKDFSAIARAKRV